MLFYGLVPHSATPSERNTQIARIVRDKKKHICRFKGGRIETVPYVRDKKLKGDYIRIIKGNDVGLWHVGSWEILEREFAKLNCEVK